VVLEPAGMRCWPEGPDLRLSVASTTWDGLGTGHGYLRSRRLEVVVTGRRAAARERRAVLRLPPVLPGPAPDLTRPALVS